VLKLPWIPLIALVALGCGGDGPSFKEAVHDVYEPCKPDRVKLAAATKATQLVFRPCGSNNFRYFDWNPQGTSLYYQTNMGPWILKDTTEHIPLGIGVPRGSGTWVADDIVAYPDRDARKIGLYYVSSNRVNLIELDQHEPEQLEKGPAADSVLFLAADVPGGTKAIYELHADLAETERAFPWMRGPMEEFTYRASQDMVCARGLGETVTICSDGETGKELHRLEDRSRASLSPDGRYLVSERLGEEISVFADAEEGAARTPAPDLLPGGISSKMRPPEFVILDRETGEEIVWEGVHGTDFDWYDPSPYFASYMLWGFDQVPMNRNITLVDLRHFLKSKGWVPPLAVDGAPIARLPGEASDPERGAVVRMPASDGGSSAH
jgi:hypothetical protein